MAAEAKQLSLFPEDEVLADEQDKEQDTGTTTREADDQHQQQAGAAEEPPQEGTDADAEPDVPEFDSPIPEAPQQDGAQPTDVPPDLKAFLQLPEEQQKAWIEEHGADGIIKAIKAVKEATKAELQAQLEAQRRQQLLEVVEDWKADHEEIAKDPVLLAMARGIDSSLLAKKGYKSYDQLGPIQLRKHLDSVAQIIYQRLGMKPADNDVTIQTEETSSGNQVAKKTDVPKSLGDIAGEGSESAIDVEGLSGLELEQLVMKMNPDDLDKILLQ